LKPCKSSRRFLAASVKMLSLVTTYRRAIVSPNSTLWALQVCKLHAQLKCDNAQKKTFWMGDKLTWALRQDMLFLVPLYLFLVLWLESNHETVEYILELKSRLLRNWNKIYRMLLRDKMSHQTKYFEVIKLNCNSSRSERYQVGSNLQKQILAHQVITTLHRSNTCSNWYD
jgi:hypothetical protein